MPPVADIQTVPTKPKRGRPQSADYEATLAEVRRLRKLGATYRQIGHAMGFSAEGVRYYVKQFPEHICPCCGLSKHRPKKTTTPTSK